MDVAYAIHSACVTAESAGHRLLLPVTRYKLDASWRRQVAKLAKSLGGEGGGGEGGGNGGGDGDVHMHTSRHTLLRLV